MGHHAVVTFGKKKKKIPWEELSPSSSKLIRTTPHSTVQHAARTGLSDDVKLSSSSRDNSISHLLFTHQSLRTQIQPPVQKKKAKNYPQLQPPPLPSLFTTLSGPFSVEKTRQKRQWFPLPSPFRVFHVRNPAIFPNSKIISVLLWKKLKNGSSTGGQGRRYFAQKVVSGVYIRRPSCGATYLSPSQAYFPQSKFSNKRFGGRVQTQTKWEEKPSSLQKKIFYRRIKVTGLYRVQRWLSHRHREKASLSRSGQLLTAIEKARGKEIVAYHPGERRFSGPPLSK